jgi:hypothetical protein
VLERQRNRFSQNPTLTSQVQALAQDLLRLRCTGRREK